MEISATGIQQNIYPAYGVTGNDKTSNNTKNNNETNGIKENSNTDSSKSKNSVEQSKARDIEIQVQRLKQREQAVKIHEQAHETVGGQYAGVPSYEFTKGPDGKRYISGGEVPIDVSREKEPDATIRKMRQVRAAALAPADPSPQDHAIAAKATQIESSAQQELTSKQNDYREKQKDSYLMFQGISSSDNKQEKGSNISLYV
ncbi:MAG: hypothetical protein HQL06_07660 [Nitrospirae bacterium]|nr:hypothetical protein [Nitrospirota bacterium]